MNVLRWLGGEFRRNWISFLGMSVSLVYYVYDLFYRKSTLAFQQQSALMPGVGTTISIGVGFLALVVFAGFLVYYVVTRKKKRGGR